MAQHSDFQLAEALDAIKRGDLDGLPVSVDHLEALGLVLRVAGEPRISVDGLHMLRMTERDGEAA